MKRSVGAIPLACLSILACTATWGRLVHYSSRRAPPGEGVVVGAYAATLHEVWGRHPPDSILVGTSVSGRLPLAAVTTLGGDPVPGYWPDTLREQLAVALRSPQLNVEAEPDLLAAAAISIGVHVIQGGPSEIPAESLLAHHLERLFVSGIGFNRDSTIAAVRISYWCGLLCGAGQTLLLARHPGFQWRVWRALTHWVS